MYMRNPRGETLMTRGSKVRNRCLPNWKVRKTTRVPLRKLSCRSPCRVNKGPVIQDDVVMKFHSWKVQVWSTWYLEKRPQLSPGWHQVGDPCRKDGTSKKVGCTGTPPPPPVEQAVPRVRKGLVGVLLVCRFRDSAIGAALRSPHFIPGSRS